MQNNVIPIKGKKQFSSGEAVCMDCDYVWVAIAETGTWQLECPQCKTMKGVYKYPFHFSEGELIRECSCGCQYFLLSTLGHMCAKCGIYQSY